MAIIQGLRPPSRDRDDVVINPFKIMGSMNFRAWMMVLSGWLAWTTDGYDYFSVSLTSVRLSEYFDKTTTQISTAITLSLLTRSLGAIIFGVLSDRFGRKWVLVFNLLLIAVFELGSSFCKTFGAFLAVRAMFGVAMGGIWGNAANTALEGVPVQARGLVSGFVQQGYAAGYLIAAVVNLYLVPHTTHTWRALYWVGTGLSCFAALFRACLPESQAFLIAKEEAKLREQDGESAGKLFWRETKAMLRSNWKRAIWAVLLMTGMNFYSHGSQDLYPTYLQKSKLLSSALASKATIIGNCGAICGGIFAGYASQFTGRRLALLCAFVWTACFIPLWIIPTSFGALSGGAFAVQFGVQGAWGVIPIYLAECSPPAFRASFAGISYQLGNMISSAAAQIEARAGENWKATTKGVVHPDYAKVQGVLIGCVTVWLIVMVLIGPENHGSHFESAVATQPGAGHLEAADVAHEDHDDYNNKEYNPEKPVPQHLERIERA